MSKLKTPIIPEFLFQINQKKVLERMRDRWTTAQIKEYSAVHSEYGAISAALKWYRANDVSKIDINKLLEKSIQRPTLFIWGTEDEVIAPEIIPLQKPYIKASYQELSLTTGHPL